MEPRRRRARGTGSVDYYKGKWRARFPIRGKRAAVGYYDAEEEAHGVLDAMVERLRGTTADVTLRRVTPTLAEFGKTWLEDRERTHRDAKNDRGRWDTHIATSILADMALDAIEPRHVRRWVKALLDTPSERTGKLRDRQTVKNVLTTLRACLSAAVEAELIEHSPAKDVQLPRGSVEQETSTDDPWTFLSAEEIRTVLGSPAINDRSRLAYAITIFTGLREGELWGLRWEDVQLDGERPELVVRYSFNGPCKPGEVGRVPLLTPARLALGWWREISGRSTGRVFPAEHGGCHSRGYDGGWADHPQRRRNKVTGELELVVKPGHKTRAGVTRHVTFHDLRHTCASHLLIGTWAPLWTERPLRLEEVRDWLRHSSVQVTERYTHLERGALHSVVRTGFQRVRVSENWSHLGDLNPGPTVYEAWASACEVLGLAREHPLADLVDLSAEYLRRLRAGDPLRDAVGARLAERLLDRALAEVRHEKSTCTDHFRVTRG